jgi:hypothetical protein
MNDEAEVMWRLYAENTAHGRHHETMRASVTSLVLVIAGAVLTVIGFSKAIYFEHWPLTAFLILVGLFGALFVVKHYERYCSHMQRARQYRDKLESLIPGSNILQLKAAADAAHKAEFRRLADWKLSKFWVALHWLVAAFGVVLTAIALTRPH